MKFLMRRVHIMHLNFDRCIEHCLNPEEKISDVLGKAQIILDTKGNNVEGVKFCYKKRIFSQFPPDEDASEMEETLLRAQVNL